MKTILAAATFICLVSFWNSAYAQSKPSAQVDKQGILRWTADNTEINEFGVNYTTPFAYAYWAHKQLNIPIEKAIDDDIYHITRLGLKTYRIHVWDSEISDTLGNLLENDHLRLLDYTLTAMKPRGFKIILTPIAFWDGNPEPGKKLPGFAHKYGKNNCYTNPDAIKAQQIYLRQFMDHVNQYTGEQYKNDPDIIGFELSNEPEHPTGTIEGTTAYINSLVTAVRSSGCHKPLFYCMAFSYKFLPAYLASNVQGGSVQWYPYSHNSGFSRKGNFLTNIDTWPKDSITGKIKASNKALIAYEFDAADNAYAYNYPVIAREFRRQGFQFATMFAYDPINLAYANTEYRTHYVNLAYTPQKALSLKIAGEVFRKVPRGKSFGVFPADTLFDAFRVSYSGNNSEMLTAEKFFYANGSSSLPSNPGTLQEIAGYGSSSVVKYKGRGAYFLDKLSKGVWRLEIMPDAIPLSEDPHSRPNLNKEVTAIAWAKWPMTISLPDIGMDFTVAGLNEGNSASYTARNGEVNLSPGVYLIKAKGATTEWKSGDRWRNIRLGEYVAPAATKALHVVHQPTEEIIAGAPLRLKADIVTPSAADRVEVVILVPEGEQFRRTVLPMTEASPYSWSVDVPVSFLTTAGYLRYQLRLVSGGQTKTYPIDVDPAAPAREFNFINQTFVTRIVSSDVPVCLFDVASDRERITRPHRRFPLFYSPSLIPGKTGVVMDAGNISFLSFFFGDKVAGRKWDMADKKTIVVRGSALTDVSVNIWVSVQLKNGSEWGSIVTLTRNSKLYELPVSSFKRILLTGPGEKGPVVIKPFPSEAGDTNTFSISEGETLKLVIVPSKETTSASIEFVTLQ